MTINQENKTYETSQVNTFQLQQQALPIGVFDSGMGGLTVLQALKSQLPYERFIYLGDTARLPYGTKSPETVKNYALQMARILVEHRIKALVIACNTATTAALSHLREMLPDIPVLGVVEPGAQAAIAATKNQKVLVLATETTVASGAYQRLITQQLPYAVIKARACSLLVALAEEGMSQNRIAEEALKHYLETLYDEDTILLACTHFPVFKALLKQLLPPNVSVVDSAQATAVALIEALTTADRLAKAPEISLASEAQSSLVRYLVTDSVERFSSVGAIFLGEELKVDRIEWVDATKN